MRTTALIERGEDGTYGIFTADLASTIVGEGNTVGEAKVDFENSVKEVVQYFEESGKQIPNELQNVEFEYKFDVASFLEHYSKVLSLAGLERLTGVNQGQLSHYVTGRRKPSRRTIGRIEKSLHDFAAEISQVQFV
jgi:predicted RNase H-like HicB family nuclease